MNSNQAASPNADAEIVKPAAAKSNSAAKKLSSASKTKSSSLTKSTVKSKPEIPALAELPVENQIPPFSVKKKKSEKKKVIRDSFSFPEQDYYKISELKKICLAAGVHVKKGEVLRAGLNLLTSLKLSELLQAIEKVERVRTGRPKSD